MSVEVQGRLQLQNDPMSSNFFLCLSQSSTQLDVISFTVIAADAKP